MEELLVDEKKLASLSVKFGKDDIGEVPMGMTRLMLVSSIKVGDEYTI